MEREFTVCVRVKERQMMASPVHLQSLRGWPALLVALALAAGLAAQQPVAPPTPPTAAPAGQQTGPIPQAPARIVTGVTVVDVPVIVLDSQGQPVENLELGNFNLQDDYQTQRLIGFDNQPRPISLAIVVDTSDRTAVQQARRAAQVVADMVVGATGEAALFIPGPEPKQVLSFTNDGDKIVSVLRHLKVTPSGSDVTASLQMAAMRLRTQPRDHTRAIVVISRQNPKQGAFSEAILEGAMNDALPVFRIYPDTPQGAQPDNPLSPYEHGTGVGSSREPMPVQPVGAHGQMPDTTAPGTGLNLGSIASAVATKLRSKNWDYVYATGGLDLHAANDGDFDRKLSEVGDVLRSTYHLYYHPDNLTQGPAVHVINLRVAKHTGVAKTSYRHTYIGMRQP